MPEIRSALERAYDIGRYPTDAEPGVTLRELVDWDLVQVAAWRGRAEALHEAVAEALGVRPPARPNQLAGAHGVEVLTVAPQRLWCLGPVGDERLAALAAGVDEDTGCVTQLGHSHVRLRIAGPGARRLLAQEVAIDLAGPAFPTGSIARTSFHHVPVLLQSTDADADTFDLYVPRTFAASTWAYLLDLARAHGYEILNRCSPAEAGEGRD